MNQSTFCKIKEHKKLTAEKKRYVGAFHGKMFLCNHCGDVDYLGTIPVTIECLHGNQKKTKKHGYCFSMCMDISVVDNGRKTRKK